MNFLTSLLEYIFYTKLTMKIFLNNFYHDLLNNINPASFLTLINAMSDREPTRWQHNRIYPHPINPCVYTYDSRLYCCETVDAHCSNIIKS